MELGRCVQDKDDFHEILEKMKEAEGIVPGLSGLSLFGCSPNDGALLDRATFVALWNEGFFTGKIGGPITVARRAGHNLAFSPLLLWYFY